MFPLHRELYVRCNPSWSNDFCAAELDNPGLTCVPLTQDRIAGLSTYYGPTDSCGEYSDCEAGNAGPVGGACAPCPAGIPGTLSITPDA